MPDTTEATARQRRWRRVIPTLRERYGMSRQTAWRWLQNPDIRFPETRFIAGSTYVDLDDLDRWDDSHPTVTPGEGAPLGEAAAESAEEVA